MRKTTFAYFFSLLAATSILTGCSMKNQSSADCDKCHQEKSDCKDKAKAECEKCHKDKSHKCNDCKKHAKCEKCMAKGHKCKCKSAAMCEKCQHDKPDCTCKKDGKTADASSSEHAGHAH